jgi:hypothetical protein
MDGAYSLDKGGKEGKYLVGRLSENTYFEGRSIDVKTISKLMLFSGV